MSQQWMIRLAAVLATLAFGTTSAHAQFFQPVFVPGNFYGNGMYGNGMYGNGMYPGVGYAGFNGGYGTMGYGTMGYNAGVYTPGAYYSGGYSYAAPIILGSETSSGGGRSTLSPAAAVAHDSPLLMAGYDAPTKDNRCVVVVVVPDANAQVWFQGSLTTLTGRVRRFTTPPLVPNKRYEYDVSVQWNDGGTVRSEPRTVQVQAGGVVNVLFANSTPVTKR